MQQQGFPVSILDDRPTLTQEEVELSVTYYKVLRIARMEGIDWVTPKILALYFSLYPTYDIEQRESMIRMFLEISLAHKRVSEEIEEQKIAVGKQIQEEIKPTVTPVPPPIMHG